MQERLVSAVQPVFVTMATLQESAVQCVRDMGNTVDATLDSIQQQVHTAVLAPLRPTLAKAAQCEAALQRLRPGLDIPDPSDLDRIFDEARGAVGQKIAEAGPYIAVDRYLPAPLSSAAAFYWRIVVPAACAALFLQLALVFATPHRGASVAVYGIHAAGNGTSSVSALQSQASGAANGMDATANDALVALKATGAALHAPPPPAGAVATALDGQLDRLSVPGVHGIRRRVLYVSASRTRAAGTTGGATNTTNDVDKLGNSLDDEKTDLANFHDDVKDHAAGLANATNDTGTQLRESVQHDRDDLAGQYQIEVNAAIGTAQSLLKSVAISYLAAAVQLALVYVLTSAAVQAWLVDRAVARVCRGVEQTLRLHGVVGAKEQVFGARSWSRFWPSPTTSEACSTRSTRGIQLERTPRHRCWPAVPFRALAEQREPPGRVVWDLEQRRSDFVCGSELPELFHV